VLLGRADLLPPYYLLLLLPPEPLPETFDLPKFSADVEEVEMLVRQRLEQLKTS
jgi:hypothetical protein